MLNVRRAVFVSVLIAALAGCGERAPETWIAQSGVAVFGVWDCGDPSVAERLLTRWASVAPPPDEATAARHNADFLPSLLPNNSVAPGWEVAGKPADADARGIAAFLRRSATEYEAFGAQRLVSAEYRYPRIGPWPQLSIEIYDMGAPENAFGVYARKRIAGGVFRTIGAESYVGQTEALGWADRYYFYVKSYQFADEPKEAMILYAQAIAKRIGESPAEPALISAYADASLVARSQRPFRGKAQARLASDRSELLVLAGTERSRGFTTRVVTGDAETAEGFCVVFANKSDAESAFEALRTARAESGDAIHSETIGDAAFRAGSASK